MPPFQRILDLYYGGYAANGSRLGGFFVVRLGSVTIAILRHWVCLTNWSKPTLLPNCWVFRWGCFVLTWY